MMKRTVTIFFLAILTVTLFTACTSNNETQQRSGTGTYADFIDSGKGTAAVKELTYRDFVGKRIGVEPGTVSGQVTEDIGGTPVYYNDMSSGIEDLRRNRIDGYMTDLSIARVFASIPGNEDIAFIDVPAEVFAIQQGAISMNQDLIDRFNLFLSQIQADGTLAEMRGRWLESTYNLGTPMPDIPLIGENGVLRVVTSGITMPFSFFGANNELRGFCVELAYRFAAYEGMTVAFSTVDFAGFIPYVISGRADIGIDALFITEERKQSVLFTEPYAEDRVAILSLNRSGETVLGYTSFDDFTGKRVGTITGNLSGEVIAEHIGTPVYYSEQSAGIEDVRRGRIDGFMTDLSILRVIAALPGFEDTYVVPVPAEIFAGPLGAFSMEQNIIDRFNVFLRQLKDDGTLADMQNRWLENVPDLDSLMPDIPLSGENGTLTVATSGLQLPFSYFGANNQLKGYSIELALRFAANEGMDIEFVSMEFAGLIPYVTSGRADFAIDAVTITEERSRMVIFSDSIYDDLLGIITLRHGGAAASYYTDFTGKRFAVMVGSVFDKIADRVFNTSEKLYFNNVIDGLQAVKQGKADAMMLDNLVAMVNLSDDNFKELAVAEVPFEELNFEYAVFSSKQEVIDQYNLFLREIKENGSYDEMVQRWFTDFDIAKNMPEFELTGHNGTLNVAINAAYPPFMYLGENGTWAGFDIEQFYRFAQYLDMDISFVEMDFGALLPYTISGRSDITSSIYVTEERKQSVIFGDVSYVSRTVLVYKDNIGQSKAGGGFIEWLQTGIQRNLITDNRWKLITDGLGVTMQIAFFAMLFGTIFGGFICWVLTRKNRFIAWLGRFYCGLIHGTPIVVLLMITYYIIFGGTRISNVVIAIAAFTMVMGANIAQTLKGAIDTVDPVEIEAARSIGFPAFKAFRTVTLPQAVRRALPGYTNGFVELVKATAIVGYVAIQDMMRAADIIRSRTFDAFFPLLFVALIYLLITTACVQLFKFIVRKAGVSQ